MQQKHETIKTVIQDVLDYGDLLIVANKGEGKTEALKVLASEFRKQPNTRIIVFETFPKWCLEFEAFPYMKIKDKDIIESEHTVDIEDFFLRH